MSGLPGPRQRLTNRDYLGTCVRCRHGIYTGQTSHRGRGLWLGLLCGECHRTIQQTGSST